MDKIEINSEKDLKKRFDIFLYEYFDNKFARTKISDAINERIFLINGAEQKSSYKLKKNDIISFDYDNFNSFLNPQTKLEPWNYPLDIIWEDENLIVLNKPKSMLTHPTKFDKNQTLVNALLFRYGNDLSDISGENRLGIVHRLDKNTSGIMLAAKNNKTHEDLAKQIREKSAVRKYLALALGEFEEKEGIINKPLIHSLKDEVKMEIASDNEGLEAITCYKVIEQFKGMALVELNLKTGRTHQIRAHLSSINHPIFGDELYNSKGFTRKEFNNLKTQEQLLQSYYISFIHPITKEKMEFQLDENKFSADFIKVLNYLRSKKNEF